MNIDAVEWIWVIEYDCWCDTDDDDDDWWLMNDEDDADDLWWSMMMMMMMMMKIEFVLTLRSNQSIFMIINMERRERVLT